MRSEYPVVWPDALISAANDAKLGLFVGNGLSRLSGGPSWAELFSHRDVVKAFKNAKIDHNELSYLEKASFLESKHPPIWNNMLQKMILWSVSATVSNSHKALRFIFPGNKVNSAYLITSNVDSLLVDSIGFKQERVIHCHGIPGDVSSWIFSIRKYADAFHAGT